MIVPQSAELVDQQHGQLLIWFGLFINTLATLVNIVIVLSS